MPASLPIARAAACSGSPNFQQAGEIVHDRNDGDRFTHHKCFEVKGWDGKVYTL